MKRKNVGFGIEWKWNGCAKMMEWIPINGKLSL